MTTNSKIFVFIGNGQEASLDIYNELDIDAKCSYESKNAKTSPPTFTINAGKDNKKIVDIHTELNITCTIMVDGSEKSCNYNGDFFYKFLITSSKDKGCDLQKKWCDLNLESWFLFY